MHEYGSGIRYIEKYGGAEIPFGKFQLGEKYKKKKEKNG
jgi:hypothetical protein